MNKYRTLIVSDVHIGSEESNVEKLYDFLRENSADILFLNGDIIDIKYLKTIGSDINVDCLFDILKIVKGNIIFITGNHDSDLKKYLPDHKFIIRNDFDYVDFNKKRYFISHGHKHIFNNFVSDTPIIERFIKQIITFFNHLQKVHTGHIFKKNKPIKKDLEYYSLTDSSRSIVKNLLKMVSGYKNKIERLCRLLVVDGVICGHIHLPEIKTIKGKIYMNSGDFVENFSALSETHDGKWDIIYFK